MKYASIDEMIQYDTTESLFKEKLKYIFFPLTIKVLSTSMDHGSDFTDLISNWVLLNSYHFVWKINLIIYTSFSVRLPISKQVDQIHSKTEEMLNDLSRTDCCGELNCRMMSMSLSELTQNHETTWKAWPDMDKVLQQRASKRFTIPTEKSLSVFINCLINALIEKQNDNR